jgi:hypothetical protein
VAGTGRGSDVAAAERRVKATELRARGRTYREIAAELGVSLRAAHRHVQAGLRALHKEMVGHAREMTALELKRLEAPVPALADAVLAGDLDAIDCWRKLSESRRKLAGLDAPERVAVGNDGPPFKVYAGMDPEQMAAPAPEGTSCPPPPSPPPVASTGHGAPPPP